MKINKISSGIAAVAVGTFLAALPAGATTISFSTTATPGTIAAVGESSSTFFNYIDASVPGFTLSTSTPTQFGGVNGSSADSFGGFTFITNTAQPNGTSSVVTVALTPTINGGKVAAVDFSGTISAVSNSAYSISFSGTPGATTAGGYTDLTSNGVTYAIETTQTLNASGAGKQSWLQGYILGVPSASTPEPATLTTTGIALCLVGFGIRRRTKTKS